MNESNYQEIADSLIANAGQAIQDQSLDGKAVFNSVKKLCESPEGGQHFVEAALKIEQESTKVRLTAGLSWVYESIIADAVSMDTRVELIKPFQVAAIGLTVAIMVWIVQNPLANEHGLYYVYITGINVTCLTLALRHLSKGRDTIRKFSARVNSLLDSLRSIGVS